LDHLAWQFAAAALFQIDAPTGEEVPESMQGILGLD
jgi:hypothetical protein